jgi:hypothetical protein
MEPGLTGAETDTKGQHYPYDRHLRTGWRRDLQGRWVADFEDDSRWEVFCAECVDSDGPAENQSEPVRVLRGPYSSQHKATHAADKHFKEWKTTSPGWIPGSVFPDKM